MSFLFQSAPAIAVGAAIPIAQAAYWQYRYFKDRKKYFYGKPIVRRKGKLDTPPPYRRKPGMDVNPRPYKVARRNTGPMGISDPTAGDQGGYNQETRIAVKTGRHVKKGHIMDVLGKNDLLSRTLFWKNLPQNFTGTYGQLDLGYNVNSTIAPLASNRLPVYLWNLNRFQLAGTAPSDVGACLRLCMDRTTGLFNWLAVASQAANGTPTQYPQVLRDSVDFPTNPQKSVYWGSFNMKLCLYGNTSKNVRFKVAIVSFDNDNISPTNDFNVVNGGGTSTQGLEHQTFWQEQVKDIISHPCALQGPSYGQTGKMKVHKFAAYEIGPTLTTESDANPHHIIVNWTHRINKKIDLRQSGGTTAAADPERFTQLTDSRQNYVGASGPAGDQSGILQLTPNVKDRLYLMVMANDYVPDTTVAGSNATCGSMDVSYTTSYYVNT